MIIAINVILMAAVFAAVVGPLARAILVSRPARHTPAARRSPAARPARASSTRGYRSVGRAEA